MDLGDYCLKHPSGKDFCKDIGISFEPKGDILMDIRLDNISKSFGDKKVLTNFSAVIKKGKVTCIMGPSGCGKTTLLNIMAGLLTPDEGNITGIPERKSAVFQEERLCETFGAISNVRIVCGKNVKIETIKDHLNRIGLGDSMNKPVNRLSGGMRRRVSIVRAVLADRDILFLDEPFKGLDKDTKISVMEYIKEYTKGKTVIMVTHDKKEAEAMEGDLIEMG